MSEPHKFVYRHYRYDCYGSLHHYQQGQTEFEPAARGGETHCFVKDADNRVISTGISHYSMKDTFCYRLGRNISRGRALKRLRDDKWGLEDDLNPLLLGS